MEFDFVYADLRVQVIFKADNDSPFGQLTDVEIHTLQQLTYMTLMEFQYVRALAHKDIATLKVVMDGINKSIDILKDGG